MTAMSRYMMVLVLSGIVPFILSFWPALKFWRNWRALVYSLTLVLVVFGAWDVLAVYRDHWHFASWAVYRFNIINLPLEEVLFFVVIPFCCIFTWEAIKYFKEKIKR